MLKWIGRAVVVAVLGFTGYAVWVTYQAGYFSRPEMPEGAFSMSFKSGFRAIIVDVPDQQETRRYFGFPADVPHYLEDAWSTCSPPTEEERASADQFIAERNMPGERFEAICRLQVDDDLVTRGLITSVPRL
jgi:hypothetical protein